MVYLHRLIIYQSIIKLTVIGSRKMHLIFSKIWLLVNIIWYLDSLKWQIIWKTKNWQLNASKNWSTGWEIFYLWRNKCLSELFKIWDIKRLFPSKKLKKSSKNKLNFWPLNKKCPTSEITLNKCSSTRGQIAL